MAKSSSSYLIGKRVQVPVWTDTWMKGDRYGLIVRESTIKGEVFAHVRLDKSGRTKRFRARDLEII